MAIPRSSNNEEGGQPPGREKKKEIWNMATFALMCAEPFIDNTELEMGHVAQSASLLGFLLNKMISDRRSRGRLDLFRDADLLTLGKGMRLLEPCIELSTAEIKDTSAFQDLLLKVVKGIEDMAPGETLLLPGGWDGNAGASTVVHLIERPSVDSYAFVTCNAGQGLAYHVSAPAESPKMKYKTCLRLENIASARMTSMAFWATALSQWVKARSDYHRVEVLYDVLLPWLISDSPAALEGGIPVYRTPPPRRLLLPQGLIETRNDPAADWRTPARAGSTPYKSLWEGLRYYYRRQGLSQAQLKQLSFLFRQELLIKVQADLNSLKNGEVVQPVRPYHEILNGARLVNAAQQHFGLEHLAGHYVGVFFGSKESTDSVSFARFLAETYDRVRSRTDTGASVFPDAGPFSVLYVSQDRTGSEFWSFFREAMPPTWLAIPYQETALRAEVQRLFGVTTLPTLIVIGPDGRAVTAEGRVRVLADPAGTQFPWRDPPALERPDATDMEGTSEGPQDKGAEMAAVGPTISTKEVQLIRYGCRDLGLRAVKENRAGRLGLEGLIGVREMIEFVEREVQSLSLEDDEAATGDGCLPPRLGAEVICESEKNATTLHKPYALPGFDLLKGSGMGNFAGKAAGIRRPQLANLLEVPESVSSPELAIAAMMRCEAVVRSLVERAQDGSSSSRLILQLQALHMIDATFTQVLPVPKAPDAPDAATCIWRLRLSRDTQRRALTLVYSLLLTFVTLWQAVDLPPRAAECERALVATAALALYDRILRTAAFDTQLAVTAVLEDDGGYYLSSAVTRGNKPLEHLAARLELVRPEHTVVRSQLLAYLTGTQKMNRYPLFELRQPAQVEFKKYGPSLTFLRRLLERCGYELIPRDTPESPSEMEALMEWMLGDATALANEHPEFALTRDVVALYKFLVTMESREAELMRRRVSTEENRYMSWSLSFDDEGGGRFAHSLHPTALRWEVTNFRGLDKDTADVNISGFGGRKLQWGEGAAVQSPADVARILPGLTSASEDDILHTEKLPTFGDTLSREESETLLSYLTVEYIRIPLVVSFFASRDRHTYLFNPDLQALLRAVLFEPGAWIPPSGHQPVTLVPVRRTAEQKRQNDIANMLNAKRARQGEKEGGILATTPGLFLNELKHAPKGVLGPLLAMFHSISDMAKAPVNSPEASYILYIISLAVATEAMLEMFASEAIIGLFRCTRTCKHTDTN
ncbi:hypothetical protein NSK_001478 [Nannochloropsis salina CCMP1776]|uniref:Thioredoxin-like fold domain-containing protein n=1 Tax=Nannochloropsis salina CCMP1776 TaxID=1027361 RepID=A0A4D9DCB9_9STRA|nr:hypothetical protein NSK_001478 [Nannochloropsis salina CCMP1776]|eukprot:TFJ87145.1 hypothetical protein NSK_001478 [Nannochloropsis salina CCMP1776]